MAMQRAALIIAGAAMLAAMAPVEARQQAEVAVFPPAEANWERRPMPVYPQEAYAADIRRAEVVLECDVLTDRSIDKCTVVSERPRGHRFGRAALQSARDARISEAGQVWVVDGKARFTIGFRQ